MFLYFFFNNDSRISNGFEYKYQSTDVLNWDAEGERGQRGDNKFFVSFEIGQLVDQPRKVTSLSLLSLFCSPRISSFYLSSVQTVLLALFSSSLKHWELLNLFLKAFCRVFLFRLCPFRQIFLNFHKPLNICLEVFISMIKESFFLVSLDSFRQEVNCKPVMCYFIKFSANIFYDLNGVVWNRFTTCYRVTPPTHLLYLLRARSDSCTSRCMIAYGYVI